jgi:hypothetical protein
MSAAVQQAPIVTARLDPARDEALISVAVTGVGMSLLVAAGVSWGAVRYLNWAMAPRRFRLRVAFAGSLPVAILAAVIVFVGMASGRSPVSALVGLANVPGMGKLLVFGMWLTGLGVAWMTATRRDRRLAIRASDVVEVFE